MKNNPSWWDLWAKRLFHRLLASMQATTSVASTKTLTECRLVQCPVKTVTLLRLRVLVATHHDIEESFEGHYEQL